MDPRHPDVQPGDLVRLPRSWRHPLGELVTVIARRSHEQIRIRHDDGSEDVVHEWEPE